MIRYLRNKEIDRRKWDESVSAASNSLMYALSWYLDIICDDWDALVNDDYSAVFPLPKNRKLGLPYSFQPLLAQQLGLFSAKQTSREELLSFLHRIPTHFLWVKLNLNAGNNFQGNTFKLKNNLVLDLSGDYATLAKNYSAGCQRNIKKSAKSGLKLEEQVGTDEILTVLRKQMEDKKVLLTPRLLQRLESLIQEGTKRGIAENAGIRSASGELCAAAIMFNYGKRLYYLVGTSNQEGFDTLSMFRILDHFIEKYAAQNLVLDFEGSEIEGIARFFKGFGAQESPYPVFERRFLGPKS